MTDRLSPYEKEDLQLYIERRITYPDVRERLIHEMISATQQLLNEQNNLRSYEAVEQVKKQYHAQYLKERMDEMEKAERKEWRKIITGTLLQQFLNPGIFILITIAIAAILFLQFASPFFMQIKQTAGITILIALLGFFIYWNYHFYSENSKRIDSLNRKSFLKVFSSIFLFIWFGPFLFIDFIDLFFDWSYTFHRTIDFISIFTFSGALTILYIGWRTYTKLLPAEIMEDRIELAKQ